MSQPQSSDEVRVLLVFAIIPPLLGLLFLLLPNSYYPTNRTPVPTSLIRQVLHATVCIYQLILGVPFVVLAALHSGWIATWAAVIITGLGWLAAVWFFVRFAREEGRKAQIEAERWKCRGCGRKAKIETPYCGWCGIVEPMREVLEEEGREAMIENQG